MRLLSSKTLIQAHALFLFILAIYLTKSPEVITDSDVVFMLGETLRIVRAQRQLIDYIPANTPFAPPGRSPRPLPSPVPLRPLRNPPRRRRARRPHPRD